MKKEYDFSRGKRGAVLSTAGKTRITIYLDDVIWRNSKPNRNALARGTRRSLTMRWQSTSAALSSQ